MDCGKLFRHPLFNGFRILPRRLFDRLLHTEAPSLQVQSRRAEGKKNSKMLHDQLPYRLPRPQSTRQVQLIRRFIDNSFLHPFELFRSEFRAYAFRTPFLFGFEGVYSPILVLPDGFPYDIDAQSNVLMDLLRFLACHILSDDLHLCRVYRLRACFQKVDFTSSMVVLLLLGLALLYHGFVNISTVSLLVRQ